MNEVCFKNINTPNCHSLEVYEKSGGYIIWREILPNIALPQLVYILSFMSIVIMIEGSLSFLGVGIPPPTPTWGAMIAEGFSDINTDPHITFLPALVLFLTVLSLNLIGDRLRLLMAARGSAL